MPWNRAALKPRKRLEEATEAVPLLKDTWVKVRLVLSHIASLSSLVSTMNTESAQQRYATDRIGEELRTMRADLDRRWGELKNWMGDA